MTPSRGPCGPCGCVKAASHVHYNASEQLQPTACADSALFKRLLSHISATALYQLSVKQMVEREEDRNRKVPAILNTMFPPSSHDVMHARQRGVPPQSPEFRLFNAVATQMVDFAMGSRVGLPSIKGITHQSYGLPAGPEIDNAQTWRDIMTELHIASQLSDMLENETISPEQIEHLIEKYTHASGSAWTENAVDLHSMVVDELTAVMPVIFHNMYALLRFDVIVIPGFVVRSSGNHSDTRRIDVHVPFMEHFMDADTIVTPTVWLYNTDGETYFDRHIITYSEMLYVVIKLEIRILTEPRRRCFIDEFQDLKLLEMHVVLRMASDARMLCARCNRPNMQIIFLGQQVQSIFAFLGTVPNVTAYFMEVFGIAMQHLFTMTKTKRCPPLHCEINNQFARDHPDIFTLPNGELNHMSPSPSRIFTGVGIYEKRVPLEHPLPPTTDLMNTRHRAYTCVVSSRNNKEAVAFFHQQLAIGTDLELNISTRRETTRDKLLHQLKLLKNWRNVVTCADARVAIERKVHETTYRSERKAFLFMLERLESTGFDLTDTSLAATQTFITTTYAVKPSNSIVTFFGSKGLEWDEVRILAIDAVPSQIAERHRDTHPHLWEAEIKLMFVIRTRARQVLIEYETDVERKMRLERAPSPEDAAMIDAAPVDATGTAAPRSPQRNSEAAHLTHALNTAEERRMVANTHVVLSEDAMREALDVFDLESLPASMDDLKVIVNTRKRLVAQRDAFDRDALAQIDASARVLRRRLLGFVPLTASLTSDDNSSSAPLLSPGKPNKLAASESAADALQAAARSNHIELNLGMPPALSPLAAHARETLCRSNMPLAGEGETTVDMDATAPAAETEAEVSSRLGATVKPAGNLPRADSVVVMMRIDRDDHEASQSSTLASSQDSDAQYSQDSNLSRDIANATHSTRRTATCHADLWMSAPSDASTRNESLETNESLSQEP